MPIRLVYNNLNSNSNHDEKSFDENKLFRSEKQNPTKPRPGADFVSKMKLFQLRIQEAFIK